MAKRKKSKGKSRGKSRGRTKAARSKAAKKGWATRRSRGLSASLGLARHRSYGSPFPVKNTRPSRGLSSYLVVSFDGRFLTKTGRLSDDYAKASLMPLAAAKKFASASGHLYKAKLANLYAKK